MFETIQRGSRLAGRLLKANAGRLAYPLKLN